MYDWVNNGEAGDLRRYCAHYDVTVRWSPGPATESALNKEIYKITIFLHIDITHIF